MTDDIYCFFTNRCQADHNSKVTYCSKQTIKGMCMFMLKEEIFASPLHMKYTLPLFNKYFGITDPIEPVRYFHQAMSLTLGGDNDLYQLLPNDLEKIALAWFHQLNSNSLSFFEALSIEFVLNYSLLIKKPKTIDHLFKVIGQLHETFQSYVARFEFIFQMIVNLE